MQKSKQGTDVNYSDPTVVKILNDLKGVLIMEAGRHRGEGNIGKANRMMLDHGFGAQERKEVARVGFLFAAAFNQYDRAKDIAVEGKLGKIYVDLANSLGAKNLTRR